MLDTPTARLMDGTALAARIVERGAATAADLTRRTGQAPCLATVLVGDDPASVTYVRMKRARCERAGIRSRHLALPSTVTTAELVEAITALSEDPDFATARTRASLITPVPGGVGPMTIAVLLAQTVEAASWDSRRFRPERYALPTGMSRPKLRTATIPPGSGARMSATTASPPGHGSTP